MTENNTFAMMSPSHLSEVYLMNDTIQCDMRGQKREISAPQNTMTYRVVPSKPCCGTRDRTPAVGRFGI